MTSHHSDILLPRAAWGTGVGSSKLIAFVPITVALVGIAAILFGGLSARTGDATAAVTNIDPTTTGSIMTPEAQRRALEMLDR